MSLFTGSGVAIITPFDDSGVNLACYEKLIDRQINEGTDAIIALGTTGEPSTMTESEKKEAIACAIRTAAGRVPVIVGTGGNNTAKVIADSKRAQEMGADGLLIVTPYYNKCTADGLVAHYAAVAESVDLPIIVYNVPGRTGVNVLPETMKRLAAIKNIVGIKEASANIEQITEIARLCPDIDLYSGNDDHVLPILALGGKGVISVTANVCPKEMHDLCAAWF
ncbi:MAG: 4-hydroxy-tetrahydrodipicolinate synthase, partial [Christensenellales bacterium]